ncbi:MAG: dihydroxy-acid dehydratase, partial [Pseudomonadota bacterium]
IYPNGPADVNHFHAAGGMGFLLKELISAGLMHADARTVAGTMADQMQEPWLDDETLAFRDPPERSMDLEILRPVQDPFSSEGGLALLDGRLGRGVIKVSAVKPEHRTVKAPVRVFDDQADVRTAYEAGELNKDVVIVVRFQGPAANGMPELHGLSPILGNLQDAGHRVALVTDGRMSGASGKVPAAIHVSPEAARGGPLACLKDGDIITLDADKGVLNVAPDVLDGREPARFRPNAGPMGVGRDMFETFRNSVGLADHGASFFPFLAGGRSV